MQLPRFDFSMSLTSGFPEKILTIWEQISRFTKEIKRSKREKIDINRMYPYNTSRSWESYSDKPKWSDKIAYICVKIWTSVLRMAN